MALSPFLLLLSSLVFGLGTVFVAWKRRHMPTWKAGVVALFGCALLLFARARQLTSPDLGSREFWYQVYLLGLLMIPTSFVMLTMQYAGLDYLLTPRVKLGLSLFPAITAFLIFTNPLHGWVWNPAEREFVNRLASMPPNVARFWYWLFIAHSYGCMGLGSFFLFKARRRSAETVKWKSNLIIVGLIFVTMGPLVDVFHLSPFPPFAASLLGILAGAILMFFNISPTRRRDLLFITRGAIIQNMSDPVFVVDQDNCLLDLNPAAEVLLQKTAYELLGQPLQNVFPALPPSQSGEVVLTHRQPPLTFDYRISTLKDWQDQIISRTIVLRDITARKQADAELIALREAERSFSKQLTALVKVTQTLSKAATLDELCCQAIELGRTSLGYDRLSLWFVTDDYNWMIGTYGTSIEGEITDEREARHPIHLNARIRNVVEGKEEIQMFTDVPLYQADGSQVGVGARISAGLWDGASVIGFLSVDNHIHQHPFTEHDREIIRLYASALGHLCTLKRAQEALSHLNETLDQRVSTRTEELQTANRELEAFAYSISHDLRAPIRAIDGYITLLIENHGTHLDEEGQRISAIVQKEARRMGRLIDDLLTFSRFSRTELRKSHVDMEALAKSVAETLLLPEDHARVHLTIGPLTPTLGDYSLLQQVWTNLLSNALKFSSKSDQAIIQIQSEQTSGQVTYSIRDNGVGFNMAYVHKLFGVFQRLHGEKEFPGTGAGLAIVHRIITRHGGKIWAESKEGVGTTFFFTLPRGI
ncbi:MAG: hypothetical protein Fur0022_26270 [Anaerolineales bacterium]